MDFDPDRFVSSPFTVGALGSLVALKFAPGASWWERATNVCCGALAAGYIAPAKAWYRAKGWLDWGMAIAAPAVGAVVVFERTGGGHVGLVVGKDQAGRLLVLGGNQGNAVSIAPFDMARVVGYRWPSDQMALLQAGPLPVTLAAGPASSNEA